MSVQVFALPYAGGSASIYRDWISGMRPGLEVCPLEYKGHAGRFCEGFFETIEEAAEDMSETIINSSSSEYVIYGHSMGCHVALETEYLLEKKGAALPKAVIFAASRPPHLRDKGKQLGIMSRDELMDYMVSRGQYDPEILANEELFELLSDIMYADVQMLARYRQDYETRKLHVPVLAMAGDQDEETPPEYMNEWERYTDSTFGFHSFKGKHFFAFNDNEVFKRYLTEYVQSLI